MPLPLLLAPAVAALAKAGAAVAAKGALAAGALKGAGTFLSNAAPIAQTAMGLLGGGGGASGGAAPAPNMPQQGGLDLSTPQIQLQPTQLQSTPVQNDPNEDMKRKLLASRGY